MRDSKAFRVYFEGQRKKMHIMMIPFAEDFICKVGQPWLHKLSMNQLVRIIKLKADGQLRFCIYTFPIISNSTLDPIVPESQPALPNVQPEPPRNTNVLQLSEQELLAAGYERKKKVWTAEEDQQLLDHIGSKNIPWKQIQQHMPGRTQKMCYSRYRRLLAEARQRWAPEDERKLKDLVESQGEAWKQFVPHFPNRTWKQLRDKYINYLRPNINRDEWSLEEDLKILDLMTKHGTKWKCIQKEMENRTDNQIKNRYYGRLKLLLKKKARSKARILS